MTFQYMALNPAQIPGNKSLANRRAAVRYKCGLAHAGRVQLDTEEWQRAWILNLSRTGVGMLLGRSLEAGLEMVVHLKGGDQAITFRLPARVCHATRQSDGDWMLGCEFLTELTDDQLDAILQ